MVGSMRARLYQERSKNTISPFLRHLLLVAAKPVARLVFGGHAQLDHAQVFGHEILDKTLDRAAFARRITALDGDGDALFVVDRPELGG